MMRAIFAWTILICGSSSLFAASRYRYVEWRDMTRDNELAAQELYDLGRNGSERINIAENPNQQKTIADCHRMVAESYASLRTPKPTVATQPGSQ